MIGIFRQKTPANIIVLLFFGLLIKLPMFLHPHIPSVQPKDGILFHAILNFLQATGKTTPILYPFLTFLLLFTQAITLTQVINNYRMMNRPNYLPGMSYILITSFFSEWNYFSAPLLLNTLLIFILGWLFKIYNHPRAKGIIFNIGLAIGVSTFIFFPSLSFVIWVFVALMIMRPFRINEWLLCLLGITTPYYFYGVYLFLTKQWNLEKILPYLSVKIPSLQQSIWLASSALLLMVPFLAGGYFVQDNLRRMLIQIRKGWSLILIYLLVAIFVPFVNTSNTFENWVMATVPFAAFHSCAYFYPPRKLFPLLLFWVSVAFVLVYQYYGPGWE
ncbi:MAG: hypothetical protein E6H06_17525 [Bacteroidetes bacterium]|nr:MAG: hypothetical protein E6H06_17525 [Bacteroidota bacterium]